VRAKNEIEEAVATLDVKKPELQLAEQVIESLVGPWNIADFENEYRRDLRAMLDAKLAGEPIARPEPAAEAPVVDLMEALRRSVAEVQGKRTPAEKPSGKTKAAASSGDGSRRKRAPARKSA
jgi:DNA end-binding protein Ku